MAENSNIAWCDHTWNPWEGCTKVSPACDNCYAERDRDHRYGTVKWGAGQPRRRMKTTWKQPYKWDRQAEKSGIRLKVFSASLADLFDAEVDPAWLEDAMNVINDCRNLDWLLLTKRPNLAVKWYREHQWWPPTAWLGTTVENQKMANARVPWLKKAEFAPIRFLSMEPLLERVDMRPILWDDSNGFRSNINWVIVGGESPGMDGSLRYMKVPWAHEILSECRTAGVPFFLKQMSGTTHKERELIHPGIFVREFPKFKPPSTHTHTQGAV